MWVADEHSFERMRDKFRCIGCVCGQMPHTQTLGGVNEKGYNYGGDDDGELGCQVEKKVDDWSSR